MSTYTMRELGERQELKLHVTVATRIRLDALHVLRHLSISDVVEEALQEYFERHLDLRLSAPENGTPTKPDPGRNP